MSETTELKSIEGRTVITWACGHNTRRCCRICRKCFACCEGHKSKTLVRTICGYPFEHDSCTVCGKNVAKRKGKSPAPICLVAGSYYAALCMTCAKKISSCLDSAIVRVEKDYR